MSAVWLVLAFFGLALWLAVPGFHPAVFAAGALTGAGAALWEYTR